MNFTSFIIIVYCYIEIDAVGDGIYIKIHVDTDKMKHVCMWTSLHFKLKAQTTRIYFKIHNMMK